MQQDPSYDEPRFAVLYDALNTWGRSDEFYLAHVMRAASVLDVGCGTGELLCRARRAGHRGHLVGLEPAEGMLAVARAKRDDITWLRGEAETVHIGQEFELVTMTGHAFQELLDDDVVRRALAGFRRHLAPHGRLVFETRNPAAGSWRRWTPELTRTTVRSPAGVEYEVWNDVRGQRAPDLVEFAGTFRRLDTGEEVTSVTALRFVDPGHLRALLVEAGLRIDGWYGDWDRGEVTAASPEVVVVAAPAVDDEPVVAPVERTRRPGWPSGRTL